MTDVETGHHSPVLLQPRDPLIFRDARPFGGEPGARAFSMSWPHPRTLAGALRTHAMNITARGPIDWSQPRHAQAAVKIAVHGPLLVGRAAGDAEWQPYVPAPKDIVAYRETDGGQADAAPLHVMVLRPRDEVSGSGSDVPRSPQPPDYARPGWEKAMEHVAIRPMGVSVEKKPETNLPDFWLLEHAARWLATTVRDESILRRQGLLPFEPSRQAVAAGGQEGFAGRSTLPQDERVHVTVDRATGTARVGALFTTESRAFRSDPSPGEPAVAILCRIRSENPLPDAAPTFVPIGGERRLSRISISPSDAMWPEPIVPSELQQRDGAEPQEPVHRLRLQLVTPAIFTHGWLPGWMADRTIPGMAGSGLGLTLVGIASDRRVPVSGWRMAARAARLRNGISLPDMPAGPKKTVYAVPAGSVYFFECTGALTEDIWKKLWLLPISDRGVHRDEGFGIVLPGIW